MKSGAVRISQPAGHVSYFAHEDEQHGQADDEVDERHRTRRASGSSVRGKYTFVTSGRFDEQAQARQAERRREVLHRQDAGDDEARIRRLAGREVRELAEDDHVDRAP